MLIKKHKNFYTKIFAMATIIVSFCLMLSLADLFSSLITVGGFSFTSDEISLPQYKVYAVCTSSYQTKIQADEGAQQIQMQGGAGYVLMDNNEYVLIASIYDNPSDAKKVLEQIANNKPNAKVVEIQINSITVSSNMDSSERESLIKTLEVFKNTYKRLYDISVSLDTSVIREINARLSINDLNSEINKTISNHNTFFGNQASLFLMTINNSLSSLCKIMQELIDDNYNPYTSKIKLAYTKVIIEYRTLADNLTIMS